MSAAPEVIMDLDLENAAGLEELLIQARRFDAEAVQKLENIAGLHLKCANHMQRWLEGKITKLQAYIGMYGARHLTPEQRWVQVAKWRRWARQIRLFLRAVHPQVTRGNRVFCVPSHFGIGLN